MPKHVYQPNPDTQVPPAPDGTAPCTVCGQGQTAKIHAI